MIPRGIRNCNPFNLREGPGGGDEWVGERTTDDDPAFEEFTDMDYGVRAGARTLKTYQRKYGCSTVTDIITRFAPPHENDTEAYIWHVAGRMGVTPDQPIDLWAEGVLFDISAVIIDHEQGYQPDGSRWVDEATIRRGILMA